MMNRRPLEDENYVGTIYYQLNVDCPSDSDDDGVCDSGGCLDAAGTSTWGNDMSLYELDLNDDDELVQSVYFPSPMSTSTPSCDPWGCGEAWSSWENPTYYEDPSSPAIVYSQFVIAYASGYFYENNSVCENLRLEQPEIYDCD